MQGQAGAFEHLLTNVRGATALFPDMLLGEELVGGGRLKVGRAGSFWEASGIKRIHDECVAVGVRVEFRRAKTGFVVSFYRSKWEEGDGLNVGDQKTVEKIFDLIKSDPQITQKQIMDKTGLTRRGVEWNLKKLKDDGRITRVGPDKGGHWEV